MPIDLNITHEENWHLVWNFRFRKCFYTGARLYPFTKVYEGTHVNNAGALFGGPPAKSQVWTSQEIYTFKILKSEI